MPVTMVLWSHALAALLFASVALARWRDRGAGLPRASFVVALLLTAAWALAVAGIDVRDMTTRIAEGLRNLGWLGFMLALERRGSARMPRTVIAVYVATASVVAIGLALAIAENAVGSGALPMLTTVRILLRALVAIAALLLVCRLYGAFPEHRRASLRPIVIGLVGLWGVDLLLYATAYLGGYWPMPIVAGRGFVLALAAPLFAMAVQREGDWSLQVSRALAWQTLTFVATLLYAAVVLLATAAIARFGGSDARLWQTAFVFGSTATVLTLAASPRLRAWAKVKLAKHLFRHRYDYRAEWMRFTDTLGQPDDQAAPLAQRIVKAVADLTDSPAGILLLPDGAGLGTGADWQWADAAPAEAASPALVTWLSATGRVVELDAVRAGTAPQDEIAAVPQWMHEPPAWALVPLAHLGRLEGVILLARPPIDRALDWEDLDLLKVAGRQVASYLAEARAQEALGEAQRFDEFNRRFAFILHDIKNLVSQLSLIARNAERHADNPAFRTDMIATLQDSVERMTALLARLSPHQPTRREALTAVPLAELADTIAARRRGQHPVTVIGDRSAIALADRSKLEQIVGHLVQNAIEASAPAEPVVVLLGQTDVAATIEVIDRGCGMSPGFVRDRLFRPFVSSKPGGFGVGAFEARTLALAMGGTLAVASREGHGTRFTLTIPAACARQAEIAA